MSHSQGHKKLIKSGQIPQLSHLNSPLVPQYQIQVLDHHHQETRPQALDGQERSYPELLSLV